MHDGRWRDVSDSAKHVVTSMLTVDQKIRWSAKQVLQHPWFESVGDDFEVSLERNWAKAHDMDPEPQQGGD